METFLIALALVFVIEGVSYALAPSAMKAMFIEMMKLDDDKLRVIGLATAAAGVAAIWLIKIF